MVYIKKILSFEIVRDVIKSILTFVIYIAVLADYGLGMYHSFKKHGVTDGVIGTIVFPWAMYRGVEFWWHDDFSDVDWDQRLSGDIQTCIYFVASTNDKSSDKFQINEDLEKFSKKINEYPSDKRQYLLLGTKKYIQYSNSLIVDFLESLKEYRRNGYFNIAPSDSTRKYENELSNFFKLKEEMGLSKMVFEDLNKQIKDNLPNDNSEIDYDKINQVETRVNLSLELQLRESNRIFKTLFQEDL